MGSSLFSKQSDSLAATRTQDLESIEEDAFGTNVSCYRILGSDGKPHAIHPFEYMATSKDPELHAARTRFLESVDMDAIDSLIDSIPSEAFGCTALTPERRDTHKLLLRYRLKHGFRA